MVLPRVFIDIESKAVSGRVFIELFSDKAPKTSENFRALCTGEKNDAKGRRLCYQGTTFDRIVAPEYIVQGGKISFDDSSENTKIIGESIYGEPFESENLGWRDIDDIGLVCMARSQEKDGLNGSQFFITLQSNLHIEKFYPCTVFGKVVQGIEVLKELEKVSVNDSFSPLEDDNVVITRCGEMEFKRKKKKQQSVQNEEDHKEGKKEEKDIQEDDIQEDYVKAKMETEHTPKDPKEKPAPISDETLTANDPIKNTSKGNTSNRLRRDSMDDSRRGSRDESRRGSRSEYREYSQRNLRSDSRDDYGEDSRHGSRKDENYFRGHGDSRSGRESHHNNEVRRRRDSNGNEYESYRNSRDHWHKDNTNRQRDYDYEDDDDERREYSRRERRRSSQSPSRERSRGYSRDDRHWDRGYDSRSYDSRRGRSGGDYHRPKSVYREEVRSDGVIVKGRGSLKYRDSRDEPTSGRRRDHDSYSSYGRLT